MKHGIDPKRKNVKPKGSKSDSMNMSSLTPPAMSGIPMVNDPGEELSHDMVPGAGFSPH